MRRNIVTIAVGLFVALCMVPGAFFTVDAADNDNFLVTMSGAYLECNIVNASWNIGTVQMSKHYWTNETGETELADTHNSTAGTNLDYEMTISSDAAVWYTVWVENYTTGADQYKLNVSSDSWSTETALNLTVYTDVKANFDPSVNASFDMRFDSPTSTTTGAQQTITTNGKVTVH